MTARGVVLVTMALLSGCGIRYSASFLDATDTAHPMRDVAVPPDETEPVFEDVPHVPRDVRPDARGHGPPYPLLLHHGFAGFRDIGPINYFYDVARTLRTNGEVVYETEVSPFLPTAQRSYELAAIVDRVLAETGSEKVVLIAHSQGGLDARYLISSLGYGDRVALLATIATPHRGSRVADAIVGNVPGVTDGVVNAIATLFGYAYNDVRSRADLRRAAESLSEAAAVVFNRDNLDDPQVVYWSWSGRSNRRRGERACAGGRIANEPDRLDNTFTPLQPLAAFLEQGDPEVHVNDGLVEVASGRWGQWMGCIPADHFDEVGQIAHRGPNPESGFDHLVFYRDVVARVRAAGY
jgi:triacylglycerol lipase